MFFTILFLEYYSLEFTGPEGPEILVRKKTTRFTLRQTSTRRNARTDLKFKIIAMHPLCQNVP